MERTRRKKNRTKIKSRYVSNTENVNSRLQALLGERIKHVDDISKMFNASPRSNKTSLNLDRRQEKDTKKAGLSTKLYGRVRGREKGSREEN